MISLPDLHGQPLEPGDYYLGHFDYTSSSGSPKRQLNFAVAVDATAPVILTEHVGHQLAPREGELRVTDSVRKVLQTAP